MAIPKPDEASIFHAARQINDPVARQEYIQEACREDSVLAGRIAALLRVQDQQPTFLASPTKELGKLLGTVEQAITLGYPSTDGADGSYSPQSAPPGYEILGELGRGGMGVVYKARQSGLKRLVALKMILAGGHAGGAALARFRVEAEAVAALQHPNIIQIYEVDECEGLPYLSLELVEGGTLANRLNGTPWPPRAAAEVVAILSRAMQYAHSRGIIHRDLKPANVLLTAAGEPKVTDFGLAKIGKSDMTATGAVMGSPNYMSPEQAGGHTREVGTHSDVWALGAILYELLTGRPPFLSDSIQGTLQQVLTRDPERPRSSVPTVPRDLETICLKCLEKDSKKRYPSAEALSDDLTAYLDGRPIAARQVGTFGILLRWRKRNPVIAAAIAIAVIALVVGSLVSTGFGIWAMKQADAAHRAAVSEAVAADTARTEKAAADTARDIADQQKKNAQAAEKAAEDAREKALDTLYATRINLAHREWLHGLSYSARYFLAQAPQARRGWEYDFLRGLFMPERATLRSSVWPHHVSGSADGSLIATASALDANLHLWDAVTGLDLGTVPDIDHPKLLRFAPKGHLLACVVSPEVRLIDADTRRTVWKSARFPSPLVALCWSHDGRQLHVVTQAGRYRKLDASTGKVEPLASFQLQIDPQTVRLVDEGFAPAISPDGRYFADVHYGMNEVKVWDLADGNMVFAAKDHDRFIGQLSFSPDGKFMASAGGEGTVVVREVPTGRLVHRLRGHKGWVWATAFSPNGRYLASGSKDTTARLWDVATGETIQVYRGDQSEVWGVTFCGKSLATSGPEGTIRLWDAADPVLYAAHVLERVRKKGTPLLGHSDDADGLVLIQHNTLPADAVFSPDGRRIATSARGDDDAPFQVIVRDLVTRQEVCRIATGPAAFRDLAFSTDGKRVGVLLHAISSKKSATELRVYDSYSGELAWSAVGPEAKGTQIGFHPATGRFEAYFRLTEKETTLVRYDSATGRAEQTVKCEKPIMQPLYLESGRRLFGVSTEPVDGSHQVMELDPSTGAVLRRWSMDRANVTAIAGAGRWLATAHVGVTAEIILWDIETGELIHKLEGAIGKVADLAFSPDGKRLLSGGSDRAARVWDLASGRELLTLSNHGNVINKVAWSRDGGRIATVALDGAVRVWSAEGGETLPAIENWVVISPPVPTNTNEFFRVERGDWRVENGDIIGTLRDLPGNGFANARTRLPTIDLPRTVDIQARVTLSKPMIIAVGLSDPASMLGYAPHVSGAMKPFGPGAWLMITNKNLLFSALQGVVRPFTLEANRPYEVRVLRQDRRIRLFVDGHELVDEKIPDIDLSELFIQGAWSAAGDEIKFSHLTVRAPAEAVRARKLQARLDRLFAEELLAEPVKARLAAEKELTEADRQTLLAALTLKQADIITLRESARSLATKKSATPQELERAHRQLAAALDLAGGRSDQPTEATAEDLGVLALVEYRLGHADKAAAVLFPALDFIRRKQGFNTLGELGLAGLVEAACGRTDSARRYLLRMRDMDRPEAKWDKAAQPLLAEAMQLADRLLTSDPAREAVKEVYLRIEDAGWMHKDIDAHFAGRTPDCHDIDQRDSKPGPYDISLTLAVQRARRTMQFQEFNLKEARILHDDWDIRISGDTAELSYIVVISAEWTGRWEATARLKRVGGEWKIAGTRSHQSHQTEDGVLVELNDEYWGKKDKAVAEATNDSLKLGMLVDARRHHEAFELGRTVVASGKGSGADWFHFSKAALNLGELNEAIRAAKKAYELNQNIPLPPWAK